MTALTNDGARQKSARDVAGTFGSYQEDMMALCDALGITTGTYNERLLGFANGQLGSSYTNINDALNAFAVSQGAENWSSLGAFIVSGGLSGQSMGLLLVLTYSGGASSAAGRPIGFLLTLTYAS